ncbi:hypothetical protein FB45DRAFT_55546 [Roridomyces roridus]|uniref:Uncharacterized protein n=1 Tax=Roridomyces roridus TaxID=1738132 RepID=A0AAD7FLL8_9AGAR|nr:hypothetical protein FB45DRAFT_55546 [Roridomyces roridus]
MPFSFSPVPHMQTPSIRPSFPSSSSSKVFGRPYQRFRACLVRRARKTRAAAGSRDYPFTMEDSGHGVVTSGRADESSAPLLRRLPSHASLRTQRSMASLRTLARQVSMDSMASASTVVNGVHGRLRPSHSTFFRQPYAGLSKRRRRVIKCRDFIFSALSSVWILPTPHQAVPSLVAPNPYRWT